MDITLTRSELEHLQRTACIMITGAMRTTPTKVLEMFLDLPILEKMVKSKKKNAKKYLKNAKKTQKNTKKNAKKKAKNAKKHEKKNMKKRVCSTDGSIPPTETKSEKPRNRA